MKVPQNKAKIFLAEERGLNELNWFRSYNTFNFGRYQQDSKTPFGPLQVLNDDTLAGGKSLQLLVEDDTEIVLLPLVGAVAYTDTRGNNAVIEAGECQLFRAPAGTSYQVSNPYEEELVNFLQVWMRRTAAGNKRPPQVHSFDIQNNRNQVVPMHTGDPVFTYHIGKYNGREETVYKLRDARHGLFVFVIEGAFEVQYRLLHARDGLALWEADQVEWEALSNDAILLVMEFPL